MNVKETANQFAEKVVAGDYAAANAMLSSDIRADWTAEAIQTAYEEMIEYFEGDPVRVNTEFEEEFGKTQLDHGTLLYVPLESDFGSEAISVVIDSQNQIVEVEFGRP